MIDRIQQAIAWCEAERENALAQIKLIDEGNWRIMAGSEESHLEDVTDKWAARERLTVERMNNLIAAYEALDA
jgi:hypothetical protein